MKPYTSGYLKVSDSHEIYYEGKGDKNGKPILNIHGGPGSGFKDNNDIYFNEKIHNIIFYDQRGAGKSKTKGGDILKENTTDELVYDILKVIDYFGITKVNLFGGSWGSTLALIFAIRHPEKVESMILRGIFLGGEKPEDDFLHGNGVEKVYPEAWEDFLKHIPEKIRNNKKNIIDYIWNRCNLGDTNPLMALYNFEGKVEKLSWMEEFLEQQNSGLTNDQNTINKALIEFYYLYNSCFIPEDYILDNCNKIEKIPTRIIHGRYDMICPFINAYKLHKKLPNSKLDVVIGGHSGSDTEIFRKLKENVDELL